jgi:dolichol-phosphate mannosyltransferase
MSVELSVVVPVFNEQQALPELYRRVKAVMTDLGVAHEIVFVNDGSVDRSWEIILSLSCADRAVKAIALSRNFGHQLAITAGLEASAGAAVVVMDADLQDPPETIPALYAKFLEGFDVAYAQRRTREGETWWKRATAKAFYRLIRRLTALEIPVDTGDFRLMSRRVVDELRRMQEHSRFLRGLVTWVGYNQTPVLYDRDRRYGGTTKFSTAKMMKFAIDGITSFSSQPLRLASHLGLIIAAASLVFMLGLMAYKLSGGTGLVPGWTSLIVTVLFLGGLQLLAIGVVGEYIGRIHEEVKGRPMYLVKERINLSQPGDRDTALASRAEEHTFPL